MRFLLSPLVFGAMMLAQVLFFSADACNDAGGQWSQWGWHCAGVEGAFTPFITRAPWGFWLLALLLALGPAALTFRLLSPQHRRRRRPSAADNRQ